MTPGPAIHLTVGVSATVAAAVTGPRKWAADTPCNMAYAAAGAGILWAGRFAFNGASALAAEGIAALAVANTLFAGYAGGLGWLITNRQTGNIAILDTMVGGIAGRGSSRRPLRALYAGTLYGNVFQAAKQGLPVGTVVPYASICTFIILKIVSLATPLRLSGKDEEIGQGLSTRKETLQADN